MNNEIKYLDIDVVGENSGNKYTGSVEVRPFMTSRGKVEYTRLLNKETKGLVRDVRPNLEQFRRLLEALAEKDQPFSKEQIDLVVNVAAQTFGVSDPVVEEISIIAELTVLVVKGPDWWKPFELIDESPYVEIKKQLMLLQNPAKEGPAEEPAEEPEAAE